MRGAGLLGAPAVILLQPKRDPQISCLVQGDDRRPDLTGQLGENRICLG